MSLFSIRMHLLVLLLRSSPIPYVFSVAFLSRLLLILVATTPIAIEIPARSPATTAVATLAPSEPAATSTSRPVPRAWVVFGLVVPGLFSRRLSWDGLVSLTRERSGDRRLLRVGWLGLVVACGGGGIYWT